jgi:uncharacterized membrane protein HdeD (DUF308 family)
MTIRIPARRFVAKDCKPREKTMNELNAEARAGGRNMTIFGVITIILGILAMLSPGLTGMSVAMAVGILVIIGGIVRMIWAFQAGSLGRGVLMFAIGVLTLLCGIALTANPLFASGVLTIMLALYFLVDGVFELIGGFQMKPVSGWGFMVFGGIVSILLGIMIWRQFPLAGAFAIGILLGIKLFFIGMIMVTGGSAVRDLARD